MAEPMLKVVLVHGYTNDEIVNLIKSKLEDDSARRIEHYFEGGYMMNLFISGYINDEQDDPDVWDIVSAIYDNEDDIPSVNKPEEPVFVGWQPSPIELETEDGFKFLFIGGVWGTTEDGLGRYEE